MRSERGGGAAGVLADEGGTRRHAEERGAGHLWERAGHLAALRLLRHAARRLLLRQLWGKNLCKLCFISKWLESPRGKENFYHLFKHT